MAWQVLLDTELVLLRVDPLERTVEMTRTVQDLPHDPIQLRAFFQTLVDAIGSVDRPRHTFVIDSRRTVGRNDEAFETVRREFEQALFGGFEKVSVRVRTEVGRLQVQRYNETTPESDMAIVKGDD
ncbi:MAG: hypothetical protein ACE37F_29895 [Nannocystaceae bacterium]|nr:hypothetical protein [bacterium]